MLLILVKGLIIYDTLLDCNCMTMLSETLARNKTMKMLELTLPHILVYSIKQITGALLTNITLKIGTLGLWNVKLSITDEDATCLSHVLCT